MIVLEETNAISELEYSGSLHFVSLMGVELVEARKARRVARALEELPQLRQAAENGNVPWASLTAIVAKATPETEGQWLDIARRYTYHEVRRIVSRTELGEEPRPYSSPGNEPVGTELRLNVTPEYAEAFRMASVRLSEEAGRRLPSVEVFELLVVGFLANVTYPEAHNVDAVLKEARKNLAALEELEQPAPVVDFPLEGGEGGCLVDAVHESTPAYDIGWTATAAEASPCPGNPEVSMVHRQPAPWRSSRVRFRGFNRLATPAPRREILRRDGFCCSTPGCPNHLWLDVHHILFYCNGGKTVPDNLTMVCSKCHRNIHEGRLVVHGSPGCLVWTDRNGVELWRNAAVEGGLGLLSEEPPFPQRWWDWEA